PVEKLPALDEVVDFPAKRSRERSRRPKDDIIPVVTATFELDDEDLAVITDELGDGAIRTRKFTLMR
ncbi:MAG: hypothetical protein AB7V44_32795, partial [Pseudonocardia sp.]